MNKIETNVVKPEISFIENEIEYLILDTEAEVALDKHISLINDFMANNNGKGKPSDVKDELYKNAQLMWKEYIDVLRVNKYNFYLNRDQFKLLKSLINQKLEYDVNTVFFAIELRSLMQMINESEKDTDNNVLVSFPVDATEMTYIYHLISKYKVKGLTKEAYTFAEILRRIGDLSKVFSYYDTTGKNLATDIQNWVAAFEDNVDIDSSLKSTKDVEKVDYES